MLAAASAERLAIRAKSHEASVDAYRYHTLALKGLREAMQSFSTSNADAILATALGCSYQMPDWFVVPMETYFALLIGLQSFINGNCRLYFPGMSNLPCLYTRKEV